jgi:hypothetical protein
MTMTNAERDACHRKPAPNTGICICERCVADQQRLIAAFWAAWEIDQAVWAFWGRKV